MWSLRWAVKFVKEAHICYHQQPNWPTLSAFGRASTLSLGSIAFGSLIVTLLELTRLILQAARNNADANGQRTLISASMSVKQLLMKLQRSRRSSRAARNALSDVSRVW